MVRIKRWIFARRITHEAASLSETTLFTGVSRTPVLAYRLYSQYTLKFGWEGGKTTSRQRRHGMVLLVGNEIGGPEGQQTCRGK